ncbi:MAG: hypothetical protein GEU90_20705 [Gemmatimonas sp.]|nr:hypothetical protein [Gemmatimonas sp.]
MADIDVQRKGIDTQEKHHLGWLWWLLGLIVLGLLAWWLFAPDTREVAVMEPVTEQPVVTPSTPNVTPAAPVTIATIAANPTNHVGTEYSDADGTMVGEVVSERAFWIEENGQRMLAIVTDSPGQDVDINEGQTVRIRRATIRDAGYLSQIPGDLDAQVQQMAQQQPVYLVVNEADLEVAPTTAP